MNNYLLWFCFLILASAWMWRGQELHEKRARLTAIAVLTGLFLASLMPNYWIAAYTCVFVIGLYRVPSPADRLPLTVYPALMFAALYVLIAPLVTVAWVVPVLWSIVACGVILSAWWGVSMVKSAGHYDLLFQFRGKTFLHLYEHQPDWNIKPFFCCGQGNVNFAQALGGAGVAAAVGLIVMGNLWGWLAFALTVPPLIKIHGKWWERPEPSQGWGYLVVIGLAALGAHFGPVALLVGGAALTGLTLWTWFYKAALWSGRHEMWAWGLQVWKDMSWQGKLIGAGPESWLHIFQQDVQYMDKRLEKQKAFATHSHNEFINALVETGVVGLVCIVGYCATALYGVFQHGPEGAAVFVLGSFFISCMMISMPSSIYHEVAFMDREGSVTGHGMPPLNIIGLVCVLLTEGVLR